MKTNRFKRGIASSVLLVSVLASCATPVFATQYATASGNQKYDDSRDALNESVSDAVGQQKYQTTKGGYYSGSDVVDGKTGLVKDSFNDLTTKSKQQLLQNMNDAATKKVDHDTNPDNGVNTSRAVSNDTKSNWLTELQQCNGIGSQLMTTILSQTKPDFVKANKIYAPFASPIGTAMGLGAILIMAFLGLNMVLDLAWITVPLFRTAVSSGDGGKEDNPKWISYEAVSAVHTAESDGDSGKGSGKTAVFVYFGKRVKALIAVGVCLLYLIQGEIWTLVSYILDLVSGFIGF